MSGCLQKNYGLIGVQNISLFFREIGSEVIGYLRKDVQKGNLVQTFGEEI